MKEIFPSDQGRQLALAPSLPTDSREAVDVQGDPATGCLVPHESPEGSVCGQAGVCVVVVAGARSAPQNWEVLPAEETRIAQSVLVHPKAKSILTAFIGGATKPEIARVFGVKGKLVRSVIAAAQQQNLS